MATMMSSLSGVQLSVKAASAKARVCVAVKASSEETSRRAMLGAAAGVAALTAAKPSLAAYGQGANVFGSATNTTGFIPYSGDGYALLLPSKWGPSKEKEFPGTDMRYEDNYFPVNSLSVLVQPSSKSRIEDYGSLENYIKEVGYLLGEQSYDGQTISEGGFEANKVSKAAVLSATTKTDKKGKTYYQFEVLTTTADGLEGGIRTLISSTVSGGALYILKIQAGDKRWFKGTEKLARTAQQSFTVA